jgi:YbbR domain-containing protein
MKKFFNSKLFYIIVALLTSFAIWVYVASNDQDVISKRFDGVRVEFTGEEALLASKGFVIIDPSVNTVSVTLSGPRNVVGLLEPADLTASVDVSKLTQVGYTNLTYSIKFPANTNEANISVRRETPQVISFNLSPVSEKTVPVRGSFDGNTAEGYTAESPVFEPSTITLRGAEALLSDISYAWVTFGEEDISVSYTTDVPFTLMDSKGNECSSTGLTANVETVKATLPILQIKEVALRAELLQGAGANAENTKVTLEPASVTVAGDSAILAGLNQITVATIDLTDFSSTFTEKYPITIDNELINLSGSSEVTVTVEIVGLETEKFTIPAANLACTNVTSGFTSDILTRELEVVLRGTPEDLASVRAENLRAVADLTDYNESAGTFIVDVRIYVDGASNVGAVGDYQISVELKKG